MTPALKLLTKLKAVHQAILIDEVGEELPVNYWPKFEMPTSGMRNGELFVMGGRRRAGKSVLVEGAKDRAQMAALFPEFDYAAIEQRAMEFMRLCERKTRSKMGYPW